MQSAATAAAGAAAAAAATGCNAGIPRTNATFGHNARTYANGNEANCECRMLNAERVESG